MKMPLAFRSLLLLAAFALLLPGCADVQTASSSGIGRRNPEKGYVVFYNEGGGLRSPFGFDIQSRDQTFGLYLQKIGGLKHGSYFVHETNPGQRYFVASTEISDTLYLNVEKGRTYYVRGSMRPGVLTPRARLQQVSRAEGAAAIQGLQKVEMREQPKLDY